MKSYASIDRIEGKFVVCEVELLEIEKSNSNDFDVATKMMDISFEMFEKTFGDFLPDEGDVFVVEHNGENVIFIYGRDDAEKQRRMAIVAAMFEKWK